MKKILILMTCALMALSVHTCAQWSIPGTAGTAQWAKIGTFAAAQGGQTLRVTAFIHQGYNAANSQDAVYTITFKTSNGVSVDANGFAGNGTWYATGENNAIPAGNIKWKADTGGVSATRYDLYIYLPQYTENCHYNVDLNDSGSWTNVGALGQTDPGTASSSVLIPAVEFILPQGNVGIGTTPTAKLDVNGLIRASGGNVVIDAPYNGSPFFQAATVGNLATGFGSNNSGSANVYGAPDGSSFFGNAQGYPVVFTQAAAERMRIDGNGKVGIGTTSPLEMLDVEGGNIIAYNTGGATSVRAGSTAVGKTSMVMYTSADASGYGILESVAASGSAYGNTAINPNGGNVGIGTTSPDEKLAVKGTIHSQEVKVDLTGWEDRVFKPAYKLPTLTAVKDYIDLNHHLPDMPSEQEIVKYGLKLGDMEKTLTKKVEELTLYLLEKDQQLHLQKEVNQSLQTRLEIIERRLRKHNPVKK